MKRKDWDDEFYESGIDPYEPITERSEYMPHLVLAVVIVAMCIAAVIGWLGGHK